MIDLIKISSFCGERDNIRSKEGHSVTTHILIAICMTTKYLTYTLLVDRTQEALINGLNSIFSKIGRTPTSLYTDRESGILPLVRSNKLNIYKKGIIISQRIVIKFCPSTGPGHQHHGLVEARVKPIKDNLPILSQPLGLCEPGTLLRQSSGKN